MNDSAVLLLLLLLLSLSVAVQTSIKKIILTICVSEQKIRKIGIPVLLHKMGFNVVYFSWTCLRDDIFNEHVKEKYIQSMKGAIIRPKPLCFSIFRAELSVSCHVG